MKIYGINLQEGSNITNLSVATGTSFPSAPNDGELFYRTDADSRIVGLYVYIAGSWTRIASDEAVTIPSSSTLPSLANTGDLYYKDSNDSTEGPYVYNGATWDRLQTVGAQNITLSGDATGTLVPGTTSSITLTTVATAGTVGAADKTITVTIDAKGRTTSASAQNIAIAASQTTSGTFADARISESSVTQHEAALSLTAAQTTSGTFADARVAQTNVTQHEAALTIAESQITDGTLLARVSGNETISGSWQFNNAVPVATPTSGSHATTKDYVDQAIAGLSWKNSVAVATTANITLSGLQTIDGVSVTTGMRVLVKNQSSASENGVYVVSSGSWTRSTDFDQTAPLDEVNSAAVYVQGGTTQSDTGWTQTAVVGTVGSDAMVFAQFSGSNTYIAGTGMTITGNTFNVNTASTARIVVNTDNIDLATVADSGAGTFKKITTDSYGRVTGTAAVTAADITGLVSSTYVDVSGDTMTGTLNLPSNGLVVGTSQLVVSGSNTGIGTAAPSTLVHAFGTSGTGTASFQRNDSSATQLGIQLGPKNPVLQVVGDSSNNENFPGAISILTPGMGVSAQRGAELYFLTSRSTTAQLASSTYNAVQASDRLGKIYFGGDNAVNLRSYGATVVGYAGSTWSSTNTEGYLTFETTSSGATIPTERLRIDSAGNVGIGASTYGNIKLNVHGTPFVFGDTRTLLALADTSVMAQGVGGGLAFTANVSTGQTDAATQLAAIYAVKENGTSGNVNSSLVISTRTGSQPVERMRVTGSGNLLLNTAITQQAYSGAVAFTPLFQVAGTGASSSVFASRVSDDGSGSYVILAKGRGTTVGTHTIVQTGDALGVLTFQGSDGANFAEGARISAEVDGAPGTSDMPGRLIFLTSADGSRVPTERMRIDSAGRVGIGMTPSAYPLEVAGQAKFTTFTLRNNLGNLVISNDSAASGTTKISAAGSSAGIISFHRTGTATTGDESMRIDANGTVVVGSTSSSGYTTPFTATTPKTIIATSGSKSSLIIRGSSAADTASCGILALQRTANASADTLTATSSGDTLGLIEVSGVSSTPAVAAAASILFQQDGVSGGNPTGAITFRTANGASTVERFRVDSSGNIEVGTTSTYSSAGAPSTTPRVTVAAPTSSNAMLVLRGNAASASGHSVIALQKTRATTSDTLTATAADDSTGVIFFEGVNSSSGVATHAYILGNQDGAAGTTYNPGRLAIFTSDGTAVPAERLRVTSSGDVSVRGGNITMSGATPMIVASDGSSQLRIGTAGAERVRIDSTGQVGIGVTPTSTLHVKGPTVPTSNGYPLSVQLVGTTAFSAGAGTGITFNGYTDATPTTTGFAGIHGVKENTTSGNTAGALYFATGTNGSPIAERMRINSSGTVLLNTSTARSTYFSSAITPILQVEGTGVNSSSIGISRNSATAADSPNLMFARSRGTAVNAITAVASGDNLGYINFGGADGTNVSSAAAILTSVDGTVTTGNVPGRITFLTVPAGGGNTLVERVRITSAGNVGIGNTPSGTYKLEVTGSVYGTSLNALDSISTSATGSTSATKLFLNCAAGQTAAIVRVQLNSADQFIVDASGNTLVTGAGGLGYGTGSGGTVTQVTSRTTGVTLNKTNGAITLVSAAGTATWQSFTVTNSTVAATDVVRVCQKSGTDLYMIHVTAVAAGSFRISFATTGGTTTEQPVFNFAVMKAVTA